MKNLLYASLITLISSVGYAQIDFDDYKTLTAQGGLPDDFSAETYQKVLEQMQDRQAGMSQSEQKKFLETTHYAIDELLHSGYVVYGDELSNYISDIADKLLKDDKKTRDELRFYILKSTATNAFSTNQGIIFVTTGLISQVSNEAQLAFVIAHEICHYRESHVLESFSWSKKNRSSRNWVKKMSVYSQDHEFEADKLAVKLYNDAGYSEDALKSTFDVLKYSYLPFDEFDVPKEYFMTDHLFIPDNLFPSKVYEIDVDEDTDDSNSSHPNIKRRREAMDTELENYSNWDDKEFLLGEDRFTLIRNISRFESVRVSVLEAKYGEALYSIFLLEREFPNSIYLDRMKAKSWLGIYQYEREHHISKTINSTSDYEGASATVHYFIRKMSLKSMGPVALRHIYDINQKYPEDEELIAIYDRIIKELSRESKFQLSNYSKSTFSEASTLYLSNQQNDTLVTKEVDTVKVATTTGSKYDRINSKGESEKLDEFDSTKFYIYALSDIIQDDDFLSRLKAHKEVFSQEQSAEGAFELLSSNEQKEIYLNRKYTDLHLGIDNIISVEPRVFSYNKKGINYVKSEKLEQRFSDAYEYASNEAGLKIYSINSRSIQSKGTIAFNERSTLSALLNQVSSEEDISSFPVDYQELKLISENYGSDNIMFSLVEHEFSARIRWVYLLGSILLPPVFAIIASIHIPAVLLKANNTALSIVILNSKTGSVEMANTYFFNEPIRKMHLGAHLYDILTNLKISK